MASNPAKRNRELAIIAVLLTAVVVVFGLYTARGLFFGKRSGAGKESKRAGAALDEAQSAYKQGRFDAALEAARRAAQSSDAATRRTARMIVARALDGLGDPAAGESWAALLKDTTLSAGQRAEAATRIGRLYMKADPPDLPGAIAAYEQAVASFPGTSWADEAAVSLADAYILNRRPELAEAALADYALKAKEPDRIQAKIGDVNIATLFSPLATEIPKTTLYTVKQGDTLAEIAKRFNTTVDLLAESNRIRDPQLLQIGTRLKVVTDSFRIVIDKSENTLSLFCHDTLMKKYPVGTGQYNMTPVGDFKIASKDIDPPWGAIPFGDPKNVLGTRWMRITDEANTLSGYGIHGTWEPETIGTHSSQGCVRMYNHDVEELFKIVTLGTPVRIVE
jgi:lipoprotein-anchoring transpeptidase ErfK/SrfK